jgi:hypothetical protein
MNLILETLAAVESLLGILLTFHALISVSFAIQGNQEVPVVIHAVMAVLAIYCYSQRAKWCTKMRLERPLLAESGH